MKAETIAINGITLIDGTDAKPLENASILIEDGKFVRIEESPVERFEADTVIDGRGKYAMPGLMDANVHLTDGLSLTNNFGGIEYLARYEGRLKEICEEAAQLALKYGTTTVFDTGNAYRPIIGARDAINAGKVVGSRIYAAGAIIGQSGPFTRDFMVDARTRATKRFADRIDALWEWPGLGGELLLMDIEQVADRVQQHVETDIDLAKVFVTDHLVSSFQNSTAYLQFSERVLERIFSIVQGAGLKLVTHTSSIESLNTVVELGADVMVHHNVTQQVPMPDSLIEKVAAYRGWGAPQPTTNRFQHGMEAIGHGWARYGGGAHRYNLERLIEAGANLCLATDACESDTDRLADFSPEELQDRPWDLGRGSVYWLRAMVETGMSSHQALRGGTRDVAIAYGVDDKLGTVEVGKIADILVLDADPIADVGNVARLNTVIKDGGIIDTAALPDNPVATVDGIFD
ncbi:amidohydrolase family protein [Paenarthrobacter sp. NPDC092416]|uniref:amidohydrolase family protein n=1 Tax=Paenarthrobacter sp. NPDC092416 TaxID=3364386 RepID=UPI003828D0DE